MQIIIIDNNYRNDVSDIFMKIENIHAKEKESKIMI